MPATGSLAGTSPRKMHDMSSQQASAPSAEWAPGDVRDIGLVQRAQRGDAAAFDALIRPRIDRLLRLAISITGNEPDGRDVVQEVCVRVWRELPKLRDAARFDAWLSRILVNGCRSNMRGRRRAAVREISIDGLASEGTFVRDTATGDSLSTTDEIRRAFGRLDADKRSILVLHHLDGRSVAEIADLLQIPKGTAMWRLHAARRALERALKVERR
jgi:RNA polymerase sigma-70 factor (ECF subfamily)